MNIEAIVSAPTTRITYTNIDQKAEELVNDVNVEKSCVTIPEIILAKIINEVPFVSHFSVIRSARKSTIIAPTAMTNAAKNTVAHEVVSIIPPIKELIKNTIPID